MIDLTSVQELGSLGRVLRLFQQAAEQLAERERLDREADRFLQRFGYDKSLAGAALLGRDAAAIARPATPSRMREIVERETSGEALTLAVDMGRRAEDNLALLEAVRAGLQETALSRR